MSHTNTPNLSYFKLSVVEKTRMSDFLYQYLTNLMHKICFTVSFISSLYMFRAHVLIIRRSKLHYTASGVMIPEAV